MALQISLIRPTVRYSFSMTGIYPLSLKTALKRDGVRVVVGLDHYRANINKNKKRKCVTINGMVFSRRDSINMMRKEDEERANKPVRKKRQGK
jgi:glycogen synthase